MTDKKTKTITLENFRSWLEGVEEMQEEDWVPSAAQWKTIRKKIDSIEKQLEELRQIIRKLQR